MPTRPSRNSSSSLRIRKTQPFLQKKDCTMYLFLLLALGLVSLLIASIAIFAQIDDFHSTSKALYGVQVGMLVAELILVFFLVFTLCKRRINALAFILGAINYAVLLPILIFEFIVPLYIESGPNQCGQDDDPLFANLNHCIDTTPPRTQFVLMMFGFVVILTILSTICVLILIIILLLYKLQSVLVEMERQLYNQREPKREDPATVNWIIESGPIEPGSECSSMQDFSDQIQNEDAMTDGDKKRMTWQRKMTMDRIAHQKLIKRQDTSKIWKRYMKSKTIKGDSSYTMRSLSSLRAKNQSSIDFLKSKTARSIEIKDPSECQLCHLALKENDVTSPQNCDHKFHQQCYDDWERKYLVETGNIPPSCPFCKQN